MTGANWRAMRFYDELPSWRACNLCRVIPKRTVLLPCEHVLCQPCLSASSQDGGGHCPLDREAFEDAECGSFVFPGRKASALKVHCWNEQLGCTFVDTVTVTLDHYESECSFHLVECSRCGKSVFHRDLSTHYTNGCTTGTEYPSLKSAAEVIEHVRASLETLNTLLVKPNLDEVLPSIRNSMKNLAEEMTSQASRFAVYSSDGESSAEEGTSEAAAVLLMSEKLGHRCNQAVDASTPSSSSSLSPRKAKTTSPGKLSFFANLPTGALEGMRRTSSQEYPQHAIARGSPAGVKFENCHEYLQVPDKSMGLVHVTVLHTPDSYFSVEVFKNRLFLFVRLEFHGMLVGSQDSAPTLMLKVFDREPWSGHYLCSFQEPCQCKLDDEKFVHVRRKFSIDVQYLQEHDFLRGGQMRFQIEISRSDPANQRH
ncbi:hypothetical protein HPB50_018337 [Hyalomma asiaticum]|uniref:Uncharacterized protein n=1 Tax=Hyalomma asiaticum TaxID=266040 RepID=A0ACB7RLN8_HYAAI|nr:hypothetical protein HPB50_018337 [Hyalomma asiaticum]